MLPDLMDIGGPWKVLPPGVHYATLKEVETRFATSAHRKRLFDGFKDGVMALCKAGCRKIFLDGSFITEKLIPADFDVCWDPAGVDAAKLDRIFYDFKDKRKKQKARFCGEFFPTTVLGDEKKLFLDYFQVDKYTGEAKGIICLKMPKS